MTNGQEILDFVEKRVKELKMMGVYPSVLLMGNYSYYLLKDHYQREGLKTTDRYFEIYEIDICDLVLRICIDRETILGGRHTEQSNFVEVYGN